MEVAPAAASTEVAPSAVEETEMDVPQDETVANTSTSNAEEVSTQETAKEEKPKTPIKPTTPSGSNNQNNNQQRRGQKRKLKEDEPFVVHENGKLYNRI